MGLIVLIGAAIAVAMYLKARREHALATALEHRQRLTEAQELFGARQYGDALKKLVGLQESPHVGRQAKLLHAQSLLGDQGPGAAAAELESLLGTRDAVAGQAHFLLASIYYEGDPCAPGAADQYHERWRQHREQAEQLIAGTATYYFLRAQATRDIQEMLQLLGKALELDRQHYDSLRERAYIYYAQHDYDKMAMDAYGMIILRPKNPQGYLLRAMARREMGQFEEALQDYNDALQLSHGDPLLYDGRRETYTRMGQYGPALRDALKCVELRPVELSYSYKLFSAYTLTGQYEQAKEQCDRLSTSLWPSGEYNPDGLLGNAVAWAWSMLVKAVIESLAAGRPWHDPNSLPDTPAHAYIV
jgi:tetratricopeptide (TPR) repeat protein